jgi:hypothetical protein
VPLHAGHLLLSRISGGLSHLGPLVAVAGSFMSAIGIVTGPRCPVVPFRIWQVEGPSSSTPQHGRGLAAAAIRPPDGVGKSGLVTTASTVLRN